MAVWDDLGNNPLQAMILGQALQNFAGGLSKKNNAPSNAYVPQGYGRGGGQGGGEFDIGDMLRMQQLQAQQANMTEDNLFQRQKFEAEQVASKQQQDIMMRGAQAVADRLKIPVEAVLASTNEHAGPVFGAFGKGLEPVDKQYQRGVIFDPREGTVVPNQVGQANERGLAAAGRPYVDARTTIDNKNVDSGFTSMLNAANDERKALTAEVGTLEEQVNSAKELAALSTEFGLGPGSDWEALAKRASAVTSRLATGEGISPQDSAWLSAYERAKKLNVDEGIRTAQKLAPVTEQELKTGVENALGPNTTIPRVLIQSIQLQSRYDRQKAKRDALDSFQANALDRYQKGIGPAYSPAAQRLFEIQWEKDNPFKIDPYIEELKTLSQKYPAGGRGKSTPANVSPTPPPQATGAQITVGGKPLTSNSSQYLNPQGP